ncbi:MAG: metallophosphatase family protein [Bacteroidota bacterium]|nr:metallophosphatase family protein [Bacteroidota bacterium]
MTRIGICSDTHGFFDKKILEHFNECDEIWHAGDIGNMAIIDQLQATGKIIRIVSGNIDDQLVRRTVPHFECFMVENFKVLLIHIAGPFGKYNLQVKELIQLNKPGILVCGHSHILKMAFDPKFGLLYINPGAAGLYGAQVVRTLIRFIINGSALEKMEIVEMHN